MGYWFEDQCDFLNAIDLVSSKIVRAEIFDDQVNKNCSSIPAAISYSLVGGDCLTQSANKKLSSYSDKYILY